MELELLHSPMFFIISLLFLFSPSPTSQIQYFINCGSRHTVIASDGRKFIGDENFDQVEFDGLWTETRHNRNQSVDPLYQTARIFFSTATYYLDIPETGFYILRFHFYYFSLPIFKKKFYNGWLAPSPLEMENPRFNVSVMDHLLVLNFTFPKNPPILNEFLLKIEKNNTFTINFYPDTLAFINAIELISTSQNITEDPGTIVTPEGNSTIVQQSKILEKTFRVNVGATDKVPYMDNLWRIWVEDDQFLITKAIAQNAIFHSLSIGSEHGISTRDDAPDIVYQTAKVLKNGMISNITWRFSLTGSRSKYFVRLHFFDVIGGGAYPYYFNVYFNAKFREIISPYKLELNDGPFYKDYFLDLDDGIGYMDITIGPNDESKNKTHLFLNGVEIFQLKDISIPAVGDEHVPWAISLLLFWPLFVFCILFALIWYAEMKRRRKRMLRVAPIEMAAL